MKRPMAILSVLAVLAVSGVTMAPASAGAASYGPVSITCVANTNGTTTYTVTYKTYTVHVTLPVKQCLVS